MRRMRVMPRMVMMKKRMRKRMKKNEDSAHEEEGKKAAQIRKRKVSEPRSKLGRSGKNRPQKKRKDDAPKEEEGQENHLTMNVRQN